MTHRLPAAFRRFWLADAVSGVGTSVTLLALQALVVVDLGGDATAVGWLTASRWLPYLVLGLVVGALVDRVRRRRTVLVATDLAQGVLLLAVPLAWWLGRLTLPVVLVVVLLYGAVSLVNGAASMAFVPRLVPRGQLQRAHARVDGADAVAQNAGPALGGLLVQAVGAPLAVLVDVASYVVSAGLLARLRVDEGAGQGSGQGSGARYAVPHPVGHGIVPAGQGPADRRERPLPRLRREVVEGLRWVYADSGLRTLAIATHVWFVGAAAMAAVLAPYVLRDLALSPAQLGLAGSAAGFGALAGALGSTAVGRRLGTGGAVVAAHLVSTAGALTLVLAGVGTAGWPALAVLAASQALHGFGIGTSNSHEMAWRQALTPDGLQARTNTTMRSLNRAVLVVGAPLAGVAADRIGPRPVLLVAAAAFALSAALLAASPFRSARLDPGADAPSGPPGPAP
ncbi:MFS transporter [Lapillicoccus jejuensis]|uniref:Putative MFS family arabinose efflux permease n=1 Tax=Lapillicoccus jejuensis TaxID=402171 RepID=A0A542DXU9_9MICO|nr:MFS transporter [Lapillicoccus jejuensis]TQJ07754.1 putative MFS family arabinose efflux permease [Lapillicoccus jejuensis]